MLAALVRDPATIGLHPMLVTGRTVAGAPETLAAFLAWLTSSAVDRELADQLRVEPLEGSPGLSSLVGPWSSRIWVAQVTRFFQAGRCRVLVGTRALLGEGWDAPRITGLADLTAVTTITSVVQTRGRALRTDPDWPEKVAVNWSLVRVAEEHPKGGNDWDRLVRKHSGFFGLDDVGAVVDGVAHLDPRFSPFAPPAATDFDAMNAHMLVRSEAREDVRALWRVGEPYVDEVAPTVRVLARAPARLGDETRPADVVVTADGLEIRGARRPGWRHGLTPWLGSVSRVAFAVADGLHAAGLTSRGAEGIDVDVEQSGEYRCTLRGVAEVEGGVFATALDEAVSPFLRPRYVVPRWVLIARERSWWAAVGAAVGRVHPDGMVWHAVPSVLAVNAQRAAAYARAWDHWVGGGDPLYTGSPEGFGVLTSQQGSDPFAVTTVMRRHWG